jgi:hypothetical protein
LHGFDAMTPIEEVLVTLDDLVRAGKIRYVGCSNFSGWHLMKSLAISEKYGLQRYIAHQAYYSLVGREYEWELMPLALDQKVGSVVWSPLGWGRLTGKVRRGQPRPETSRLNDPRSSEAGPPVDDIPAWSSMHSTALPRRPEKPCPRLPSTGSCSVPRLRLSSLERATRNSFAKISLLWAGISPGADRQARQCQRKNADLSDWHQKGFAERNPFRRRSPNG